MKFPTGQSILVSGDWLPMITELTYTLKTRVVVDPPNVPPGTYVESKVYFGNLLAWHDLLGPIENNVMAIRVQDELTAHFNRTVLFVSDNLKNYQRRDARLP